MYSVILCGGSGTRLWPLSRKNFPKQFLKLYSDKSLLQETYLRMREIMPREQILFVTNQDNYFNVLNQIHEIDKELAAVQIVIEPKSLNTAPAMALAVKHITDTLKADVEAPIIFLPADHYIGNREAYLETVRKAFEQVGNMIGTIGITPTKPETGYGYIRKGRHAKSGDFFEVLEFKEKPTKEVAEQYLRSGEYVWNSGMYVFNAKTFAEELRAYAPEISALYSESLEKFLEGFGTLPAISIDYAISEKSKKVIVFEGDFGWSDIGSFDSLAELADGGGVSTRHIDIDSKNVFVHSENNRLVATIGMDDVAVVETNDSILVYKRGRAEEVKKVVEQLREKQGKELEHNIIVHRPWGKYEVLIDDARHKVKRITVYPGAKLSLQSHFHRVEHWIVVKGIAKIVNGDKDAPVFLKENESTFIPSNTLHRLENPGKIDLEIIEVQTGDYLEEDDIVRFDDVYKRA
jgi:mannose-1-phosphate guanylyltransferase/mannose-6-phosphate isomerase